MEVEIPGRGLEVFENHFNSVSEELICAKLSKLKNVHLEKGEK